MYVYTCEHEYLYININTIIYPVVTYNYKLFLYWHLSVCTIHTAGIFWIGGCFLSQSPCSSPNRLGWGSSGTGSFTPWQRSASWFAQGKGLVMALTLIRRDNIVGFNSNFR